MALASLDCSRDTERAAERWRRSKAGCARAWRRCASLPLVGDVRVIGGVGIVELVTDKATRSRAAIWTRIGPRLTQAFLDRGLLLRPLGNVLYFMPPYVITEAETAWMIDQVRDVLTTLA